MTTKTNRFASILLVLAMLLTAVLPSFAALAEGTAKVTFVSSAAEALKPGDTFTVTPKIEDNPGFAGVTWKLEYDNEALELVSIQKSRAYLFGGGTFIPNVEYGQNNLVYANGECEIENGDLCVLNFKVRENAAAGDYTVSVAKSDADFKFVALNSVNVPVDFTPCTVQVAGSESEYANAQIVYCKGTAGAYEYIPVGDTLYINNYAKQGDDREVIAEYKIAVVNKNEIVSEMSDDQWAVEGSVFKTAAHVASDPDGVFTVNATGKLEDAAGKLTATLPDGTALTTNVHVTKTPWKITPNGVAGISGDQYRSSIKAAYAYVGDTFKFTYQLQTATNGTVKGTNLQLRFSSANDKIASVAADGTITAVGKGSTKITVSAVGYNYGVPTEIALLNPIDVYVDPDYITNFVLADADGNVRTENTASAKGTVPQLTMNAGEEITLFVKGMPNLANAECSGTIASQKQFTVKTGKTALTATTNDDGSVTLKAGNVTEDTTATVTSPQYYRSKVDSSNLFAETFTLTVNIKAAPDYSKAYLAVRQGKGTTDDPYTYQAIGDETVYLNAHGAVGGMSWTGAAGIFAMLGDEPIEGVTWALENKDNAQFDTLNENQYKPGVCVNARASGGKVGANALTATLPNGAQLTAKLEMVFLATKMPITGLDGADVFSARFTGSGDTRQDYYAGSVGSQFTVKYNLLYQNSIMKDADRLATNHVIYRSTNESVATVDENGVVTLVGAGEATINAVLGAKLALRDQELVSTPIHVQCGDYATDYNWYKNGEKLARDYDVSSYTPNTYIYTKTSVEEGKETEFTVKSLPEGTTVSIVEDSVASKDASTVEVTMKDATTLIIKGLKESAALTQVSVKLDRGTGTPSFANIYVTVEKAAVPAVESVTLDKRELSLNVEETDKLTATVLPADADQSILWTSSNEQVATVSEDGTVTAIAEGTATITAKSASDETKFATCEVTVTKVVPVTGITWNIDNNNSELKYEAGLQTQVNQAKVYIVSAADAGKRIAMTATYKPTDATNQSLNLVQWALTGDNADQIASVDEYGTVTWKGGYGKVQISGAFNGTTQTDNMFFTPGTAALQAVLKDDEAVTGTIVVKRGQPATFKASWTTTNDAYTPEYQWMRQTGKASQFAKAEAIGEKNQDLVVTAEDLVSWGVADGGTVVLQLRMAVYQGADTAHVLPRAVEWKTFKVQYDATVDVTSVTLDKSELSMNVEETDKLTATVLPADADQSILWTSSNEQVATVSEDGTVTAIAEGTATITAKSASDETKLATCEVTVKSNKAITITSNYDSSSASNFPKVYGRDGLDIRNVVTVTTEPAGLAYDLKVDLNGILNNTIREAMRYDADTYMLSIRNTTGMLSSIPVVATLKDDPSVTATEMISVNFIKVKVNGLTVADENGNTEGTYKVGDTLILKAVYDPANATMQDTRWESKNTDVATVEMLSDPNGVSTARVTIVGEGTAEIGVWPNNNTYSEGYAMRQTYQVNVPEQPKVEGLTALLGCDQTSVKVGDEVIVNLYVDSDDAAETYNAFQFGVNFTENLTYVGFDGLNTESDYNYVDADGNTVTVSGFGKSKAVSGDTALVTLRFKANAAGEAKVTLPESAAFANGKSVAVSEDLQNIKVLNNEVILNVKKTFAIPVTGGTVDGGSDSIPATEGESTSFKPDAPDDGKRIDEVRINGEKAAPNDDGSYTIPNPTEDTTVEIVTSTVTYKVTFSGNGATDADGAGTASHGTDYRFTIRKDANYNYTVSASVGGAAVTVTGEYEIAGEYVTGDITIVINKTEKTPEEKMRTVTAYLNDGDAKEMEKVAHDAQSYAFTNPYAQTAKPYKATVNGTEAAITETDGGWTIAGPFAGDVAIYFGGVYNVTRPTGVTGEDTAQYQEDYNFTVGADYASGKPTVTIGGVEYALADGTADDDGSVTYVISGASITGDIVITLPEPEATVEVNLYFKAEDVSGTAYNVYLVTAKPGTAMPDGRVYAYDGTAMFWSEEYKAFAYLVSTNSAFTAEEATKHVAAADGDKAQKTIDYGGDVNMSGKTDLNDAQLTYDLYNATYHDFSVVSMEKMLRSDVSRDKQIDVADVTAIVAIVRK